MKNRKYLIIIIILISLLCTSCKDEHTHEYIDGICDCGETDPNYEMPHVHEFIDGKCSCGETDPNYEPPHVHEFIDGKCSCGETDPNYEPPHVHEFIDGKCSCGETDPNYVPPHVHEYIDGKCSCGETDSNYVPPHDHEYIDGNCSCGETDPNYEMPHVHEFIDGKCSCGETDPNYVETTYTITFVDYDNTVIKTVIVTKGEKVILPDDPIRDGYIFIGWDHDLENIESDLTINAKYYQLEEKIVVGSNEKYQTLEEALKIAKDGDIIYINEGTYEGAIINKEVEIRGNNYNIDPTSSRNKETTFTSDLIINASNVIINGVELTDKAKFTFDNLNSDVENIKLLYSKVTNSLVNADMNRDSAPFNLAANNNHIIKNVMIDYCYVGSVNTGRPMAMYIVDVEDLTVQNSSFLGGKTKGSYNDAVKVDNAENGNATFGIRGNVIFKNNTFKDYYQYALWFREYGSGTYLIEDNYFENVGQTVDSHLAVSFISGKDIQNLKIDVLKNKILNGYGLFRIDTITGNTTNIKCNVNENALISPKGTYYIKNGISTLNINARKNYYGVASPLSSKFLGSVDYSDYYSDIYDVSGQSKLELKYSTTPYVDAGKTLEIKYNCYGFAESEIEWSSSDNSIATVDRDGKVTGISKGTVHIKAVVKDFDIEEIIIVEVYESIASMKEVERFVLSIMNSYSHAVTAANSRTNYGVTNPYLYSIYRSATNYLFEDLNIDTTSYPRNGSAPLVNNKVEYITIHDTWALPRTAKGLAEYFQTDITSVHYTVGNDGIYQIVRLTDKAAHAGDSPYRAYALEKTNVLATTTKPVITMTDGYFTINGEKTNLRPYTDYEGTIQDMNNYTTSQLTYSGIRCIIGEDGYYYLGKTYFNDTYKTVSNFGGNANSIGIEMESQKGTDFYYNMHRTAKLVAMLMDKFNLTTNDVKMHNYFSGKNCAQLLKNNLKYQYNYQIDKHNIEDTLWDEFLDLCNVELQMLRYSKNYKFEFVSGDTTMIDNTGRVINHKVTRECVAYKIIITDLATNEKTELNSSIIIPSSLEIDPDYITKR